MQKSQNEVLTQPMTSNSNIRNSVGSRLDIEGNSKKSFPEMVPRVTRRMSKIKSLSQSISGKCVICLGNYEESFGKLPCGHIFCLQCVTQWWSIHPTCPFCRDEILYITTSSGDLIGFEDLPPVVKNQEDINFIAHCQLCWGEVESFQEMNICTLCRGVYWHRRCLPYNNTQWYCLQCAGEQNSDNEQL